jgi:hypothetical protein
MTGPLHIGFIPLVDAAALIVAVDKGFAAAEGLDVTLVREVSWSNVRDKLNIGLFDAAHLIQRYRRLHRSGIRRQRYCRAPGGLQNWAPAFLRSRPDARRLNIRQADSKFNY